MHIARSIRVTGHVQGVFFREWAVRRASEFGVSGWIRNRSDGSVEAYASGAPDLVEQFVDELRRGSPAARVDKLEVTPAEVEMLEGFQRRRTV